MHVIKRIDPISYRLLSDQDIINAFRALVTANKWDQKS